MCRFFLRDMKWEFMPEYQQHHLQLMFPLITVQASCPFPWAHPLNSLSIPKHVNRFYIFLPYFLHLPSLAPGKLDKLEKPWRYYPRQNAQTMENGCWQINTLATLPLKDTIPKCGDQRRSPIACNGNPLNTPFTGSSSLIPPLPLCSWDHLPINDLHPNLCLHICIGGNST